MLKKYCNNCGEKISRTYEYCPHCGLQLKKRKEITREGLIDRDLDNEMNNMFGSMFESPFFNNILQGLTKELDKQFRGVDKNMDETTKTRRTSPFTNTKGVSISISSGDGGEPKIRIQNLGDQNFRVVRNSPQIRQIREIPTIQKRKMTKNEIEKLKKLSKLPQTEPTTSVRRLTNKIIYEIDLPGVKKEDILVKKLQNSIEIKAFAKDKAFFKLIPISLPILKYSLEKGKLILELKPEV